MNRTVFRRPLTAFSLVLLVIATVIVTTRSATAQGRGGGQRGGGQALQAAPAPASTAPAPPGDAKRGADYFLKYGCWECHGYTGQTGTAPRLISTVLNARGFINYIRNPRTQQMPTYTAKVLPDQEAADIYAHIKTFKQPPELKDIPLLQQIINEK